MFEYRILFAIFFTAILFGCSSTNNKSTSANVAVTTDAPKDDATPEVASCSKQAESIERAALAENYGKDPTDAMMAGQQMLNVEVDCATKSTKSADIAHHYTLGAIAYQYMALHGPDIFENKKNDLEGAVQSADSALSQDGISKSDQRLAIDTKESAQEKLDQLKASN